MDQAKPDKGKRWIERSEGSKAPEMSRVALSLAIPTEVSAAGAAGSAARAADANRQYEGDALSVKRSRLTGELQPLLPVEPLFGVGGLSGDLSYGSGVGVRGDGTEKSKRRAEGEPEVDGGAAPLSKRPTVPDNSRNKLTALPDEMLVAIFKRLDLSALSKISQTNKRLYNLSHDKIAVSKVLDNSVKNPSLIGKYLLEIVKKNDIELLKYYFEKNKQALNNVDLKDLLLLTTQKGFGDILNFLWQNMTPANKNRCVEAFWLESVKNKNFKLVKKIVDGDYNFSINDNSRLFKGICAAIQFDSGESLYFLLDKIRSHNISIEHKAELLLLLLILDDKSDFFYLKKLLKKCNRQVIESVGFGLLRRSTDNFLLNKFLTVHPKDKSLPQDIFFEKIDYYGNGLKYLRDAESMIFSRVSERSIKELFEFCKKINTPIKNIGYYWYYKAITENNNPLIDMLIDPLGSGNHVCIKILNLSFKLHNDFVLKRVFERWRNFISSYDMIKVCFSDALKLDSLPDLEYFFRVLEENNFEIQENLIITVIDDAFCYKFISKESKKSVLLFLLEKAIKSGAFEYFFNKAAADKNIELLNILFDKPDLTQEIVDKAFCNVVFFNNVDILEYFVKNTKFQIKPEICKQVFVNNANIEVCPFSMEYLARFLDKKDVERKISQSITRLFPINEYANQFYDAGSADKFLIFKKLLDMTFNSDNTFRQLCDIIDLSDSDFNKYVLSYVRDILVSGRVKNDESIRSVFQMMINWGTDRNSYKGHGDKKVLAMLREYFFILCCKDNLTDNDISRMRLMFKLQYKKIRLIHDDHIKSFMRNFGKTGIPTTLNNLLRNLNHIKRDKKKMITNKLLREIFNGAIDGQNVALISYIFSKKLLGDQEIKDTFFRAVRENKKRLADAILLVKSPCPIAYDEISTYYTILISEEAGDGIEYHKQKFETLKYLKSVLDFIDYSSGSEKELEARWQAYMLVLFDKKGLPIDQSDSDNSQDDSFSDSASSVSQVESADSDYDSDEFRSSFVGAKYPPRPRLPFYSFEQDARAQEAFLRANPGYTGDGYDRGAHGAGPA